MIQGRLLRSWRYRDQVLRFAVNRQSHPIIRNHPIQGTATLLSKSGVNPARLSLRLELNENVVEQTGSRQHFLEASSPCRVHEDWSGADRKLGKQACQ